MKPGNKMNFPGFFGLFLFVLLFFSVKLNVEQDCSVHYVKVKNGIWKGKHLTF